MKNKSEILIVEQRYLSGSIHLAIGTSRPVITKRSKKFSWFKSAVAGVLNSYYGWFYLELQKNEKDHDLGVILSLYGHAPENNYKLPKQPFLISSLTLPLPQTEFLEDKAYKDVDILESIKVFNESIMRIRIDLGNYSFNADYLPESCRPACELYKQVVVGYIKEWDEFQNVIDNYMTKYKVNDFDINFKFFGQYRLKLVHWSKFA